MYHFLKTPLVYIVSLDISWKREGFLYFIMRCCEGSGGGGVHCFSEFLIFTFDGCAVNESEKIGWVGRWGGAVGWDHL